jgi:hypothetical protein
MALSELINACNETRARVALGEFSQIYVFRGLLGSVVSNLRMATTNEEAKEDMSKEYKRLRELVRIEKKRIESGSKKTINLSIMDELEEFQDNLQQQIQNVGLGYVLQKNIGKTEQMKIAFGRR